MYEAFTENITDILHMQKLCVPGLSSGGGGGGGGGAGGAWGQG